MIIKHLTSVQKKCLANIASLYADEINHYICDEKDKLIRISESREVLDYAKKDKELPLISYFAKLKDDFSVLSYINKEGVEKVKLVKNKVSENLRDLSKTIIFQNALMKPNDVVILPIEKYSELGVPVMRLAIAKNFYFGNEFIGLISGTIPLSKITKNLSKVKIGDTGFISIIDNEGNILSYPQKDKIFTKIFGNGEEADNLISNATSLNSGFVRASILNLDGFFAYTPIKDMRWSIIVTLPYKEFMAAPNSMRNISIIIFTLVLLVGWLISFAFSNKITNPLLKLASATLLISKGDFSQKIDIKSRDEIGRLAVSFNKMTEDLSASIEKEKQLLENEKKNSKEKEALIREIYHRTNNNMQVIQAMLVLRAAYIQNDEIKRTFSEIENKIHAMGLVHKMLYNSKDLSSINLKEYVHDLVYFLVQSSNISLDRISLKLNVDPVFLLIDTAIPCGLILNELMSNSLKHAFPGEKIGEIAITISKKEEIVEICFSDNGIGVSDDFNFFTQSTLGLKTIITITKHQLKGNIKFEVKSGVTCHIQFHDNLYTPRI
ncbi:MAG: HAMP domain-containing protein [Desulfobacterales bacterium]|nr:HAMP domain-containing protein [Desulfobacterales bacterium]